MWYAFETVILPFRLFFLILDSCLEALFQCTQFCHHSSESGIDPTIYLSNSFLLIVPGFSMKLKV